MKLLVIGGTAIDTFLKDGKVHDMAGGAGVYTALAAARCGAQVDLLALKPEPLPKVFDPVFSKLRNWQGPVIPADELSHFEISLEPGRSSFRIVKKGPEALLDVDLLPEDIRAYDCVHVTPVSGTASQLEFAQALRLKGARAISAGTFIHEVRDVAELVRSLISQVDYFFMNEREAITLFGSLNKVRSPGKTVLFITLGKAGVLLIHGKTRRKIPAIPVEEIDPTGAGDVFCGCVLAHLSAGYSLGDATQEGMQMAAACVTQIGPTQLT